MSRYASASYLEAEVHCFHCGHTPGVLSTPRGVPAPRTTFRSVDGSEQTVSSLTQLRCDRCQGSVYTDDFEVRYVYPQVDFLEDRPRRGRPPKRLVELRRAQEALKTA